MFWNLPSTLPSSSTCYWFFFCSVWDKMSKNNYELWFWRYIFFKFRVVPSHSGARLFLAVSGKREMDCIWLQKPITLEHLISWKRIELDAQLLGQKKSYFTSSDHLLGFPITPWSIKLCSINISINILLRWKNSHC